MTSTAVSKTFLPNDTGGYDISGTYFSGSGARVTNGVEIEDGFATFSSSAVASFYNSVAFGQISLSFTLNNSDYLQTQPILVSLQSFDYSEWQDAIESNKSDPGGTVVLGEMGQYGEGGNLVAVAFNYAVLNYYSEGEGGSIVDIGGGSTTTTLTYAAAYNDVPDFTNLDLLVAFQTGEFPADSGNSDGYLGLTKVSNVSLTVSGITYTNLPIISGTATGQAMLDDDIIAPFTGITLTDPSNPLGGGDIIEISIVNAAGVVDGSLGTLSLQGFPPGTLATKGNGVYVLRQAQTTAVLQSELNDLLFTPTSITAAPSEVVTLALSYEAFSGTQGTTHDTSTTIDISHDQRVLSNVGRPSGTDRTPFNALSGISVTDPYTGDLVAATITVQAGTGTLSGGGIVLNSDGTYSLSAGSVDQLNSELQQVLFTATPGLSRAGSTSTAGISVHTFSDDGIWSPTTTESVVVLAVAGAPTITGHNAITVQNERSARPFVGTVISDDNDNSQDSLLITPSSLVAGGTLSGAGLNVLNNGTYALSGTAAQVTAQLQALSFTPAAGAPNSSTTTTFTLLDRTSVFTTATSSTFSITDVDQAVAPTLKGGANSTVQSEAASLPFAGVTLVDPNVNSTDTLTIKVSGGGTGGVLSGAGLSGGANGLYTLTGTRDQVTSALQALVFTPTPGTPGTSTKTNFDLIDRSSTGLNGNDLTIAVTNVDPTVAPTLAGSGATTVLSEAGSRPFATATLSDPNAGSTDTLTITLAGGGGILSGGGLPSGGAAGTYTLSGTAAQVTSALQALVFTPAAGAPNSTATTRFTLGDINTAGSTATIASFGVTDIDPAVAPTLAGAASLTVQNEAAATPFANAVLTDPNANSLDTLTIQLSGGGAGGTLSGAGLSGGSRGTYTLGGTAAQVTAALQALVFTPVQGASNGSATTNFTLTDTTTAGTSASAAGFAVTNTDPVGTGGTLVVTGAVSSPGPISNMTVDATSAGSHTIVAGSGSKNLVKLGSGGGVVSGSGTGDAVVGGNGVTSVSGLGGGTSVTLGDGSDTVNLATAGAYNVITTGNGNSHIAAGNGGHEQVTAGGGANVISAGGAGDAIVAGNGGNSITLTGPGASVTTGSGNDAITVLGAGGAMIQAGLGLNKISFAGTGNLIVNQGGTDSLTDTGSGNTIVLSPAGAGLVTIGSNALGNGDVFDLRAAMAATSWDHAAGDIGSYLIVSSQGANATVSINPSGAPGGPGIAVAVFTGAGPLSLSNFLPHTLT